MKKITFLLALTVSVAGFSQELLTDGDFESQSLGAVSGAWYGAGEIKDDGGGKYYFADVTSAGNGYDVNLSQKGLSLTQGTYYKLAFDASSNTDRTAIVGIGLSANPWTNKAETINLTTNSQRFELTLEANFTSADARVIFDLGAAVGHVVIDNVSLTETTAPAVTAPTAAAATPPSRDSGDVISLYSDAYTDVSSTFDAGWCGAGSVEEVQIDGNNTQYYKGNACQGIVLDSGVDASAFNKLHVDVYISPDVTDLTGKVFNLKFVGTPTSIVKEYNFNSGSTPALVAGQWVSIDVDVDLSTMSGFKEFAITCNLNNTLWYDNLYIYKDSGSGGGGGGSTAGAPTTAAPAPPTFNNASDASMVFAGSTTATGLVTNSYAGATETTVQIEGNDTKKLEVPTAGGGMNFAFAPIDLTSGGLTHLYFNYYTEAVGVGKVFNVNIQGGGANWIYTIALPAAKSATATWQTVDVAISGLTDGGNGSTNAISQVQITGAGPSNPIGDIYIDNVLFYKDGTAGVDTNELFNVSVSPNPASNFVNLRADETITKAEVYNILGKKVRSLNVNANSTAINISDLNAGIYLLKYEINNKVGTTKFVKQ